MLGIGRKISLVSDSSLDWKLDLPPGRVEVRTHDGRHWIMEGHNVPGNAGNPMTWPDIHAKFRQCASVAARPVSEETLSDILSHAGSLEALPDATVLLRDLG